MLLLFSFTCVNFTEFLSKNGERKFQQFQVSAHFKSYNVQSFNFTHKNSTHHAAKFVSRNTFYKFQKYAQCVREYFNWTAICFKIKVRKSHYYIICQLNLMKVGSVPLWLVHSVSLRRPQCGNSRNVLFTRFYVKSILGIFKLSTWRLFVISRKIWLV